MGEILLFQNIVEQPFVEPYYEIIIDSSKVDSTLTDFPLMVKLDSSFTGWSDLTQDSGYFTDEFENILDHEIEYYSQGIKAVYHVRIPSISSSSNTKFRLYLNGFGYTNGNNPADVWDSSHVAVWNMYDGLRDSTNNNHDASVTGIGFVDATDTGKAAYFDGSNDYGIVPYSSDFKVQEFAISTYAYLNDTGSWQSIIQYPYNDSSHSSPYFEWAIYIREQSGGSTLHTRIDGVDDGRSALVPEVYSRLTHLVIVLDDSSNQLRYYKDGNLIYTRTSPDSSIGYANNRVRIGSNASLSEDVHGTVEYIKFLNNSKNDAWFKAEYHSTKNSLISNISRVN